MCKIRIGVLSPASIAERKMIPAIKKSDKYAFCGVAIATIDERRFFSFGTEERVVKSYNDSKFRAKTLINKWGGRVYFGFQEMLCSNEIDVIYIPLPPSMHFFWGKKALEHGKSVIMEKPFTVSLRETEELLELAKSNNLALFENFAYIYSRQVDMVNSVLLSGDLGDFRLMRSNFGFPYRGKDDFRYKRTMGGGALLDCGCYTVSAVRFFLGEDVNIEQVDLYQSESSEVDIYGGITAKNEKGVIAQLAFSMEQQYCCDLEIWGTKGSIKSSRIYTLPPDEEACLIIRTDSLSKEIRLEPEDQFVRGIEVFYDIYEHKEKRKKIYDCINTQAILMNKCMNLDRSGV